MQLRGSFLFSHTTDTTLRAATELN